MNTSFLVREIATVSSLNELLPEKVTGLECAIDPRYEAELHPMELAMIQKATAKRRQEFASGRHLAKRLLEQAGHPTPSLLAGADRTPLWPLPYWGSITHSGTYCGCLLSEQKGVGLDAERERVLDQGLFSHILRPEEVAALDPDAPGLHALWTFAAKEAAYKAQYARTRTYLGFHAMCIAPSKDGFTATLLQSAGVGLDQYPEGTTFRGRWGRLTFGEDSYAVAVASADSW